MDKPTSRRRSLEVAASVPAFATSVAPTAQEASAAPPSVSPSANRARMLMNAGRSFPLGDVAGTASYLTLLPDAR